LEGQYPLDVVVKATSHYQSGFQFSKAFKLRKWDGKKHYYNKTSKSMPAGLAFVVRDALLEFDKTAKVQIVDEWVNHKYTHPLKNGYDLHGIDFGKGRYDYQLKAAKAMVAGRRGVIKIATNGGKSEIAAAVTKHIGRPTLFLVERLELLHQTRKRFAERLQIPEEDIGIIGDSQYQIGGWITIATPASLQGKLLNDIPRDFWHVVIADECHHVGSDTFFNVMACLTAPYRFGMSGTPLDRSDGADLRLIGQTGPTLYEVSNKLLVQRGISVPPSVEIVKIDKPVFSGAGLNWASVEKKGVTENEYLHAEVVKRAVKHAKDGHQVLILVEKIKHGKTLEKLLKELVSAPFISGKEPTDARAAVLDDFKSGQIRVLIATSILDEGVDVPCIDVLILAAGGKAKIRLLQRVGRGLRTKTGKDKLLVIDFANFTHKWLLKHSLLRLRLYKAEECFLLSTS
jgi:superfamily II DNA or RNA helicase